jgi:hypothetical protein
MPEPEMLNIDQFAEHMKVSRSLVFEWMDKQILIAGRHYWKQGRVVRFPWSGELISRLLEDCLKSQNQETLQPKPAKTVSPRDQDKPGSQTKGTQINWEYE